MYSVIHKGDNIGKSNLESGDPEGLTVSGVFHNVGGAKPLAGWIKSVGGEEDKGVVFIALNEDFMIVDQKGTDITYTEAHLIAVPDDDEAYLDLTLTKNDYGKFFSEHIDALDKES